MSLIEVYAYVCVCVAARLQYVPYIYDERVIGLINVHRLNF